MDCRPSRSSGGTLRPAHQPMLLPTSRRQPDHDRAASARGRRPCCKSAAAINRNLWADAAARRCAADPTSWEETMKQTRNLIGAVTLHLAAACGTLAAGITPGHAQTSQPGWVSVSACTPAGPLTPTNTNESCGSDILQPICPSSDDLRLFRCLRNGGSGSSGFEVMRPAADAASVSVGWSGA